MATLFLTFAGISAAPAVAVRDPAISALLGMNALAWMLIARCFS